MPALLPASPSQFLRDEGELTFRVCGREHDGRLIRIRSPKCTIGSAAGCTFRLRAAGVRPLHCWVLRGTAGTIVRRLHGVAALNGGAFDEAPLSPGDRLQLGDVELDVVACNEKPAPAAGELFAVPPVDTAELEKELAAAMEKITRLETESRQGWQSSITAAERADQLRTALANAHQQLEDACRELAASQATMQRQTEELHELRAALTAAQQADQERAEQDSRMSLENAALREEHNRCLAELNDARTALAGALDEQAWTLAAAQATEQRLTAEYEQSQTEQQRIQAELADCQRRLEQRDAELRALREEAAAQAGGMTVAMDQLRRTVDMSQVQSQSKQAELEQQLAACQAELAGAKQTQADAQQLLESERQARARQEDEAAQLRYGLDQEREQLRQQLGDVEQELQAAREQLTTLAAEQQSTATQWHERELQLDQQASQLDIELAAVASRMAELDAQRVQLAADRDELSRRAEELAERERQAAELAPQSPLVTQPFTSFETPAADSAELEELKRQLSEAEAGRGQLVEQVEMLQLRCQELEEQRRSALAQAAAAYCQAESQAAAALPVEEEPPPNMTVHYEPPIEVAPSEPPPSVVVADEAPQRETLDSHPNDPAPQDAAPAEPVEEGEAAAASVQSAAKPGVRDSDEVESVLQRLCRSGSWRDHMRASPKSEPAAREAEAVPSSSASDEHEESIDNYMDRLLKRVRGEPVEAANRAIQPLVPSPAPAVAPPVDEVRAEPEPTPEPEGDYIPRTTAPEQTLGLAAMRDVANNAARTAIETHIRKHTGRQAAGRLFTAMLILAVSGVVAAWAWNQHSLTAGVCAGLGAAAGLLSTLSALRRMASVIRLNRSAAGR